ESKAGFKTSKKTQWLLDEISKFDKEEDKEKPQSDLEKQWVDAVAEFSKTRNDLKASKATEQWLSLYDQMWSIPKVDMGYDFYGSQGSSHLKSLITALPHSNAWELLLKKVNKRDSSAYSHFILKYIVSFLNGDDTEMIAAIKSMEAGQAAFSDSEKIAINDALSRMVSRLQEVSSSLDEKLERFLKDLEKNASSSSETSVIDLVTIIGEEESEAVLKNLLIKSNHMLMIPKGVETIRLARKVALENIDQVKAVQWNLTHSVEGLELYEALVNKFDKKPEEKEAGELESILKSPQRSRDYYLGSNDRSRTLAKIYYMTALIVNNRQDEAKVVAKEIGALTDIWLNYEIASSLKKAGYTQEVYEFLTEVIDENSLSQMWEYYIPIAVEAGESSSLVGRLKKARENEKMDLEMKMQLTKYLYKAYLSLGEDDNAEALIASINIEVDKIVSKGKKNIYLGYIADIALGEMRAGRLLDNKKWIKHGMALYEECLVLLPKGITSFESNDHSPLVLSRELMMMGKYKEAEKEINTHIIKYIKSVGGTVSYYGDSPLNDAAKMLLEIYHTQERYDDVLALIKEYPYFSVYDVRGLIKSYKSGFNAAYVVANAFYHTGKKDLALSIAKEIINQEAGHDLTYELIIKILSETEALELLEFQYRRDRFEERPLIFKAEILLKGNKVDEALVAIEQAIAIDPSDGEQGKGSRMRAYHVMSEIMGANGDAEKQAFYASVVNAIRKSEMADAYYANGMIMRALDIYRASLETFEDAYCIQSRMAVKLEGVGRYKEAEEHFQKAYELMPNSFGRQESHCFGCELVFANTRRQSIADKVFLNLLKKEPNNPKVHYLLGYLRMEEGKMSEARDLFRKATVLDPIYINAWKKRKEVKESISMSREESDDIIINIVKLDPVEGVFDNDVKTVWDLRRLLKVLGEVKEFVPHQEKRLFILEASKKRLSKESGSSKWMRDNDDDQIYIDQIISQHILFKHLYSIEALVSE
ncbi:MAG: tetratricopeptide (TPR) repeat protein, partial [Candidatus Omnitrophota bacterium]